MTTERIIWQRYGDLGGGFPTRGGEEDLAAAHGEGIGGTEASNEGGLFVVRQGTDKDRWFHANYSTPYTRSCLVLHQVTLSQSRPGDLLQYAVAEAVAVLTSIEQHIVPALEQDVAANGGTVAPLVLLCHSRGGLVARTALKQLGSGGVPHLRKVITLCTPHHGSYMPKLADEYNTTLSNQMDFGSLGHNLPSA